MFHFESWKQIQEQESKFLEDQKQKLEHTITQQISQECNLYLQQYEHQKNWNEKLFSMEEELNQLKQSTLPQLTSILQQPPYENSQLIESTLNKFTSIIQLLEIPQLIETCIRNDMYFEAMELDEFIRSYSHTNPLLSSLQLQSKDCIHQLCMDRILKQLSGKITIPQALQCTSFLRKFSPVSEVAQWFTICRIKFMKQQLELVKHHQSFQVSHYHYEYLISAIDFMKQFVFDFVTQFQSIFSTTTTTTTTNSLPPISPPYSSPNTTFSIHVDNTALLLSQSVFKCIDYFAHSILAFHCKHITQAELISKLWDRLGFCQQSWYKLGFETQFLWQEILVETHWVSHCQSTLKQLLEKIDSSQFDAQDWSYAFSKALQEMKQFLFFQTRLQLMAMEHVTQVIQKFQHVPQQITQWILPLQKQLSITTN